MTTWQVKKMNDGYFVVGLPNGWGDPHTMLLYRYPAGDVDDPFDTEKMLGALYDLVQTTDGLSEGTVFETPHGTFEVVDVFQVVEVS